MVQVVASWEPTNADRLQREIDTRQMWESLRLKRIREAREMTLATWLILERSSERIDKQRREALEQVQQWMKAGLTTWAEVDDLRLTMVAIVCPEHYEAFKQYRKVQRVI